MKLLWICSRRRRMHKHNNVWKKLLFLVCLSSPDDFYVFIQIYTRSYRSQQIFSDASHHYWEAFKDFSFYDRNFYWNRTFLSDGKVHREILELVNGLSPKSLGNILCWSLSKRPWFGSIQSHFGHCRESNSQFRYFRLSHAIVSMPNASTKPFANEITAHKMLL